MSVGCTPTTAKPTFEYSEYYLNKVALFDNENKAYASQSVDIVFLGDSLTDGFDNHRYFPQYCTLNRGIAGDTTTAVLQRLDVSLLDIQPRVVVMLIGINNYNTMFDDYELLLQRMQTEAANTKVILLSLTPVSNSLADINGRIALNNVRIKHLAKQYGFGYVDIFSPLYDFDKEELVAAYTVDGIHFSQAGYEVIVDTLTPYLIEALGK